jgi:hypothetical protein
MRGYHAISSRGARLATDAAFIITERLEEFGSDHKLALKPRNLLSIERGSKFRRPIGARMIGTSMSHKSQSGVRNELRSASR